MWAAMGLTQKIKALWSLCEWQLVDSERFRKLVKSEEEPEVWVRECRKASVRTSIGSLLTPLISCTAH